MAMRHVVLPLVLTAVVLWIWTILRDQFAKRKP